VQSWKILLLTVAKGFDAQRLLSCLCGAKAVAKRGTGEQQNSQSILV